MDGRNRFKVFVGLSGGVDSSVAALLLKQQGYEVVGVYMKNWSKDLPGHHCPWKEDYQDAKRVAVQLGIPFKMYDFQKDYKHLVVDYMLKEFQAGRTPNPDIMCNQEVKFNLFLKAALADGADMIATGHYARVENSESRILNSEFGIRNSGARLLMARDHNKDQTYFLCRMPRESLEKVIFPLGKLTKTQVRALAKKHHLVTADKKDSMGICFVGKVGIKDFLSQYVKTEPGKIIDQTGQVIGQHEGAVFYTIGQRHGLEVGGGLPYYVTGKNMKRNEVYVTTDLQDKNLWGREVQLSDVYWLNGQPPGNKKLAARNRHRSEMVPVKKLNMLSNSEATLEFAEDVRALTPGQSTVLYTGDVCLGGGIVSV